MDVPLLTISNVYHIGTLDISDRAKQWEASYEGHALSVSLCPHSWRKIAKLGGNPLWECENNSALYVDCFALPDETLRAIIEWSKENELIKDTSMWRTWRWDDEQESWCYMLSNSLEDAVSLLDDPPDDYEDIGIFLENLYDDFLNDGTLPSPLPEDAKAIVEEVFISTLTQKGVDRTLGRISTDVDASDIAVMFWIEDVLHAELPDVIGIWWREEHDPEILSSPRGAILPSRIGDFVFKAIDWYNTPEDEVLLSEMPDAEYYNIKSTSYSL